MSQPKYGDADWKLISNPAQSSTRTAYGVESILEVLERIDARLARIEAAQAKPEPTTGRTD